MITAGTILMEKNTACPEFFHILPAGSPCAWETVTHSLTHRELTSELSSQGWTFFYMANAIRITSCGFNRQKMIYAALQRLIECIKKQKCNCLEVDDVTMRRFLGIPYVQLTAHPRHIQKGMVFSPTGASLARPNMVN